MASRVPVEAETILDSPSARLTAVAVSVRAAHTIAFLGDSRGNLHKVNFIHSCVFLLFLCLDTAARGLTSTFSICSADQLHTHRHARTRPCTPVLVRTFIDMIHSPAPNPKSLTLTLTLTLKQILILQTICEDPPECPPLPKLWSLCSQNVSVLSTFCNKYKNTHTHYTHSSKPYLAQAWISPEKEFWLV